MLRIHRRGPLVAALLGLITLVPLGGCGGGDAVAPTAAPTEVAATAYTEGPIEGFGSIIVGGVRWDDASARITDDNGGLRSRSDLRLGMVVAVDGHSLDKMAGVGRALAVRFGSETVGPVASPNSAAQTFVVLGQTIEVTATTVFDDSLAGGFAALTAGKVVEVHGLFDATRGRTLATRIEAKPSATSYTLRGVVSALDGTAKTFRIGSELISYAGLAGASPVNGQIVKLSLQTQPVAGAWVAIELRGGVRHPENRPDAHLVGIITAWTSAQAFEIGGIKVDASGASFPDGTAGVVLGARVEVEGSAAAGTIVARKVEVKSLRGMMMRAFELHGTISALDASAKTFVLRGVLVSYAGNVTYKNGTAADLANGRAVEVKAQLSSDRRRLEALSIEFE